MNDKQRNNRAVTFLAICIILAAAIVTVTIILISKKRRNCETGNETYPMSSTETSSVTIVSKKPDSDEPEATAGFPSSTPDQTENPEPEIKTTPATGLTVSSSSDGESEPVPDIKIAAKINQKIIKKGEDLQVYIYYGTQYDINNRDPDNTSIITAKILMSSNRTNPANNMEIIKEIGDLRESDYRFSFDNEALIITVSADVFTEKEAISSPEQFTKNEGAIIWVFEVNEVFADSPVFNHTDRDSIVLYYRIKDETVFLYANQYDFLNDICK